MAQFPKAAPYLLAASLAWLTLCPAALGSQGSGQQVTLGWNASPDPTVVGYYLYYGSTSGVYANKINVGTNTTFTVTSLIAGSTNYFTTTSYNAAGVESGYVPEVSYIAPGVLSLTQNPANGTMRVQFPVAPGQSYQLQTSSDLKFWVNLWLSPTVSSNAWIEYDEPLTNSTPSRFYRLILN